MVQVVRGSEVEVTDARSHSVEHVPEEKAHVLVLLVGDAVAFVVGARKFLALIVEFFELTWLVLVACAKDGED